SQNNKEDDVDSDRRNSTTYPKVKKDLEESDQEKGRRQEVREEGRQKKVCQKGGSKGHQKQRRQKIEAMTATGRVQPPSLRAPPTDSFGTVFWNKFLKVPLSARGTPASSGNCPDGEITEDPP